MAQTPLTRAQMSDVNELLVELREAGQDPDRALMDRILAVGPSAVRPLIEMAIDEDLNQADQESAAVWAPLHAVRLLGELRAAEAVQPLLPLFAWDDDDWLAEALPEAFGRIGEPALPAMEALLVDRSKSVWTRVRAAGTLTKIAQQVPALRDRVIATLTAPLESDAMRLEDDDIFTAFLISELLNLDAIEALPVIDAAFDHDRVDQMVVDEDDVARALNLASPLPGARRRPMMPLPSITLPETAPAMTWSRAPATPVRRSEKVGRNAPCPCGSGQKYKKCCGR